MTGKRYLYSLSTIIFSVVLLTAAPKDALALRQDTTLADGVTYISDVTSTGNPIRAVIADTTRSQVSMEGPAGTSCSQSYNNSEFVALSEGTGANSNFIAAINGLFISSSGVAMGDYIGNKVFLGTAGSQWNISIDHTGRLQIGNGQLTPETKGNYSMFMRGGYRIGESNGKTFLQMTDEDVSARFASIYESNPANRTSSIARTFLGVNPAENKIILFTGGSGENRSRGITPMEAVRYLKALGATEAFTLDGGSSTFMRVNNRFGATTGNSLPDGGGLDSLVVVRSGSPLTEAQTNALPVKNCRADAPQTPEQPQTPPVPPTDTQPGTPVSSNVQQAPPTTTGQVIPLEIPINGITSISGEQNYILTYSRILFNFAAALVGLLALLMLIVSGFQIIIGGTEQIGKAKERIVGSVSGLVLLATGGFILYLINPCFYSFSTNSACTPRTTTGQEYAAPAAGIPSGGANQPTSPSGSTPHISNNQALNRVNQLAEAHRNLPPLVANPPTIPARSIAYPRTGGGYNFYTITDEDKLWMGRMIEYEGGANNRAFGAELLWIVVQRFDWNSNRSGTFTHFMQAFSQPINPSWRRGGSHCPTVGAGTSISVRDACSEQQLAKRDQAATRTFESLSPTTRATVESFVNGTLLNPVPGVIDFASNVRVERNGAVQTVGLGCSRENLIFVRNKGAASGEPTDHSNDDCNANSDHLFAGNRNGQSSLDRGYERIQVTRSTP